MMMNLRACRSAARLHVLGLILATGAVAASSMAAHAACQFAPVKQAIDTILDREVEKGAKFRSEVKSGADSIAVMESLVSTEMAEQIDICRYDVGEYLTKRGFPPFH